MSELQIKNELLSEDVFWNIIKLSLENSDDIDEQESFLSTLLDKISPQGIVSFKLRIAQLANDIHTSEMWCAGYLMNGGCSDDGFEYFKNWVISRGEDVYYKAKANPDNLADCIEDPELSFYEFENLDYLPVDAFESQTGEEIWDYLPENERQEIEFNWDEDNDDSLKAICPKIFEKVEW